LYRDRKAISNLVQTDQGIYLLNLLLFINKKLILLLNFQYVVDKYFLYTFWQESTGNWSFKKHAWRDFWR